MANNNLKEAKAAKNDEFYTQYHDIEIEMSLPRIRPRRFSGQNRSPALR